MLTRYRPSPLKGGWLLLARPASPGPPLRPPLCVCVSPIPYSAPLCVPLLSPSVCPPLRPPLCPLCVMITSELFSARADAQREIKIYRHPRHASGRDFTAASSPKLQGWAHGCRPNYDQSPDLKSRSGAQIWSPDLEPIPDLESRSGAHPRSGVQIWSFGLSV